MANIYLRLPTVIAYYHRNYDVNNKLDNFTPMKFSPYTDHAVVMRGGLVIHTSSRNKVSLCYSQQEFRNILNGKSPDGSRQVMKRDPSIWPTYDELCACLGVKISSRSDSYDYLCIQMPNTILIGDREVRTNACYALSKEPAEMLQELLVRDFKRALIDWEIGTQDFCINRERIIRRGHMDTLERFLMRYDIPIPKDGIEKESLRRQLDRWLAKARVLEKAYRSIDIEYEDSRDVVINR